MYISTIASNPDSLTSIANQISENYESGIQMIKTKLLNEILTKKIKRKKLKKWKNCIGYLSNTTSSCNNTFPSTCKENSKIRKEKDDLKECTFKPVINTNSSTSFYKKPSQNSSVYE